MAIISESARWGDINQGYPATLRTKDDAWIPAINNTVSKFINLRTPIVIQQLKNVGLLNDLLPPAVKKNNITILDDLYNLTSPVDVKFSNYNSSGSIYYTTDGSDPRLIGGELSSKAIIAYNGSTTINISYPLVLKARVLDGTDWSPLREIVFTNKENRENIRITEIQYHPIDYGSIDQKDLEFIEFKNIGDKGIDMGGLKVDSGVNYTFPVGTIINPKGFAVIASDKNGFKSLYNLEPTGLFSGNLSNDGERIVLVDESNNVLINVKYEVKYPWSAKPDGSGFSLVAKSTSPGNNPDDPTYWQGSRLIYGSPFADDSGYVRPSVIESLAKSNCEVYPVPTSNMLYIKANNNTKINMIQLFDVSGRILLTKHYDSLQNTGAPINISLKSMNVANGVYLLKINTQNGIEVKKLIFSR